MSMFASPAGTSTHSTHPQRRPQMPGDDLRPWHEAMGLGGFEKNSPYVDPPSNNTSSSFGSTSTTSPNNPTGSRRRREPDATRRIVVASFNNETDALEILAKAATDADGDGSAEEKESALARKRVSWADDAGRQGVDEFVLVRRGILDEHRLELLVQVFFQHHHAVLVRRAKQSERSADPSPSFRRSGSRTTRRSWRRSRRMTPSSSR